MTWFTMFKKARESEQFSREEMALLEIQARAEVEAVFSGPITNQPPDSKGNGNGNGKSPAYHRVVTRDPEMARSTKRANVMPLLDWRTIDDVAEALGILPPNVETLVSEGNLARIEYRVAPDLVHVRQVAYYLEHRQHLDVDTGLFDEWKRQADIARETGIEAQVLSKWIAAGEIAVYKPNPRIVLLNEREVYQHATNMR